MKSPQEIAKEIRARRARKDESEMGGVTGPGEVMEENDDYLSQDGEPMPMDLKPYDLEKGNEDQEEARREARMAKVMGKLRKAIQ